jgi:hypothetical protein
MHALVLPVDPATGKVAGREVVCPICLVACPLEGAKVDLKSTSEAISTFCSSLSKTDGRVAKEHVPEVADGEKVYPKRKTTKPDRLNTITATTKKVTSKKVKAAATKKVSAKTATKKASARPATKGTTGGTKRGKPVPKKRKQAQGRGGGNRRRGRGRHATGGTRGGAARPRNVVTAVSHTGKVVVGVSSLSPAAHVPAELRTASISKIAPPPSFQPPVLDPNLALSQLLAFQSGILSAERIASADRAERQQLSDREHRADRSSADGHKAAERQLSSQNFQMQLQQGELRAERGQQNFQLLFTQQTANNGMAVTAARAAERYCDDESSLQQENGNECE